MSVSGCKSCGCEPCGGACGCGCESAAPLQPPSNRPGLAALNLRLGTYSSFFQAALRRLAEPEAPAWGTLGTHALSDPAIALLDAWAMVADTLTFYRERYGVETYLRTAQEEVSLRLLAQQIGYRPRPGVAAGVWLAYDVDPTAKPLVIPAGAKVQSTPRPGEQMQTFETSEALDARAAWSALTPRQTAVPPIDRLAALLRPTVRLNDATLAVRPGERLLFLFDHMPGGRIVREVAASRIDATFGFVELTLKPRVGLDVKLGKKLLDAADRLVRDSQQSPAGPNAENIAQALKGVDSYLLGAAADDVLIVAGRSDKDLFGLLEEIHRAPQGARVAPLGHGVDSLLENLAAPASAQPRSSRLVDAAVADRLGPEGAVRASLLKQIEPELSTKLYSAWQNLPANDAPAKTAPELHLLRVTTGAFGAFAPFPTQRRATTVQKLDPVDYEFGFLDTLIDGLDVPGYALVDTPDRDAYKDDRPDDDTPEFYGRLLRLARVVGAQATARSSHGLSAKVTRLELRDPATDKVLVVPFPSASVKLNFIRRTLYTVKSQPVTLAPEPLDGDIGGARLMLDGLYEDLRPGRWIVVAGERSDIVAGDQPICGVKDAESALIAGVAQEPLPDYPGDAPHTVLVLATPLAHRYRRAATTIHGNVVRATHGETVSEIVGSGDAAKTFQSVALRRAPLTFTSAPTPAGVSASAVLRVNGIAAAQVDSLLDAAPEDLAYELAVDAAGAATATLGDGKTGRRAPTGSGNLRATYRVGVGSPGNVEAGQLNLLTTRPLGVRGVANPIPASGGANRDDAAAIRANAPIAALTLAPMSRLVGVSDYACFARRFAGVGAASANRLADGAYACVFVTVAGVDDAPLKEDDPLLANLAAAYAAYGDPSLPVVIAPRERVALFVQARVALKAGYDVDEVEPKLRARLCDAFSFRSRGLARNAYASEVVALLQNQPGVERAHLDVFGGVSEWALKDKTALEAVVAALRLQVEQGEPQAMVEAAPARPSGLDPPAPRLLPAQAAYLTATVPQTLALNFEGAT